MCSLFTVILFISNPLISLLVHLVTPHWRELPRSEMACALVLPRTFPESPGFTSFWIFDVRAYEPGFILGWIGCFWRICVQVWGDEQALLRAVVLDPLSSCKPLQSPSWRRRVHALELSRVLAQNPLFSKTRADIVWISLETHQTCWIWNHCCPWPAGKYPLVARKL